MADFSKEYCQIWDPKLPYDFSVKEIAKDLHKGNYYPIICEGFGFVAIAKDKNEQILLAFKGEEDRIIWQDFDNFMSGQFKMLDQENKQNLEDKIF